MVLLLPVKKAVSVNPGKHIEGSRLTPYSDIPHNILYALHYIAAEISKQIDQRALISSVKPQLRNAKKHRF